MRDALITCHGARVGGVSIPAFTLRRGDLICLHMPSPINDRLERAVGRVLTGVQTNPNIEVHANIRWVEPLTYRGGLFSTLFGHPRAIDWLARAGGINWVSARRRVSLLDPLVDGRIRNLYIACLPAEAKALLSLEAAWARSPDAIVLQMYAVGHLGEKVVYENIREHLKNAAVIHLCHEHALGGFADQRCFPGARCLETITERQPSIRKAS